MFKVIILVSVLFCLSVSAAAQSFEKLQLRQRETLNYEKDKMDFRYENDITAEEAVALYKNLTALSRDNLPMIYRAPGADADLYLVTAFSPGGDRERMTLYRKSARGLIQLYKSPAFRSYYGFDLKIFEGENRSLILAEKREGVGDYIDTEVFEMARGRVRYLGNVPVGSMDEQGNVDGFAAAAEIVYQAGAYRIKIPGKSYIPAGARSPGRNTLVGTSVTYVYDGRALRLRK